MKKFIKTTVLSFTLLGANLAHSQTTVYADTVLAVSSEYNLSTSLCTNGNSACRILGLPDVYPLCQDEANAWAFSNTNTGVREWIEVGYFTQLYVDTVRIYETNHSGIIDTVYLRDAQTGLWNTVYTNTANLIGTCNVLDIIIPTSSYKVDAVRFATGTYSSASTGFFWPEYDAIALIGTPVGSTSIQENRTNNPTVFPNPTNGQITVKTEGKGTTTFTVFDVLGNVVFSQKLSQETENISLNIPSGIYVSVIEMNGETTKNKLIIQ